MKFSEEVCPGETECGKFRIAASEVGQEKAEESACTGCRLFPTKPGQVDSDEITELVEEIEDMILDQDSGFDFPVTELYQYQLIRAWRTAENRVKELRAHEMSAMLKAICKKW